MMHCKTYILLMVLLGIAVCSVFADSSSSKIGSALTSSKKTDDKQEDEAKAEKPYKSSKKTLKIVLTGKDAVRFLEVISKIAPNSSAEEPKTGSKTNSNTKANSLPECRQLIDKEYPIFSDMCGAVPQARYILPNSYGHRDRGVLSDILTTLMSSTNDQRCILSLRFLLCPMLFQPCRNKYEPPLVLPCQSFCRAVKAQCGSPALNSVPCDVLPHASDFCPVIPVEAPAEEPSSTEPSEPSSTPLTDTTTDTSRRLYRDNQPKTATSDIQSNLLSRMSSHDAPVFNARPGFPTQRTKETSFSGAAAEPAANA